MKKDINWINAVKALCMIMVYVVHGMFYYGVFYHDVALFLHPVYVNAFFFVSGYLMFRKQLSHPVIDESRAAYLSDEGTGRKTLANIVFRMWIPALLFSFISFIPKKMLKGGTADLGSFLFETFGGGTYWFVSALLVCQIAIVVLLTTRQRSVWFYFVIMSLLALAGTVALPFYGDSLDYYSYQLAPLCMAFLALGALYWRYESQFGWLHGWHVAVLAAAYVAFFVILSDDAKVLINMKLFNFTGYIGSVIGCLLMVAVCKQLPQMRLLTFIGTNSIVFYFLSGAVPVVVNVLFKRLSPVPGTADFLLYIVACVALATAITYVIQSFLPFLTDLRMLKK